VNSFIGHLYPSTKGLMVLLILVVSMSTQNVYLQLLLFSIVIILSIISGTLDKFLKIFIKSIFLIVVFIFIVQVFIIKNSDSETVWGFIGFSKIGLATSIDLSSRIIAISSSIIWFFQVTSIKNLTIAMENARISKKITFVVSSTIQLIPQMTNLSKTINEAQRARGIETEGALLIRARAFLPMLGPLVLTSIQQTEERVLTLESRGFSATSKKTTIIDLKKKTIDYVICIFCLAVFVIYLIWRNLL
jgi:energy-coupling factor transporter transmembrane protein EcfT